jgi:hypothetical protein
MSRSFASALARIAASSAGSDGMVRRRSSVESTPSLPSRFETVVRLTTRDTPSMAPPASVRRSMERRTSSRKMSSAFTTSERIESSPKVSITPS